MQVISIANLTAPHPGHRSLATKVTTTISKTNHLNMYDEHTHDVSVDRPIPVPIVGNDDNSKRRRRRRHLFRNKPIRCLLLFTVFIVTLNFIPIFKRKTSVFEFLCHNTSWNVPVKRIVYLGEGGNAVYKLLNEVLDEKYEMMTNFDPYNISNMEHSMLFRNVTILQEVVRSKYKDVLWLMVVQNPCDWLNSVYQKYLCVNSVTESCSSQVDYYNDVGRSITFPKTQNHEIMDRIDFFKNEWEVFDGGDKRAESLVGQRARELAKMDHIVSVAPFRAAIIYTKVFEKGPRKYIRNLVKQFGLVLKSGYEQNLINNLDLPYNHLCLDEGEWKWAQQNINWTTEVKVGITPFDCGLCLSALDS